MSYSGGVTKEVLEDRPVASSHSLDHRIRAALGASPSLPTGIVFILAVTLAIGWLAGRWAVVVWALSFWHYLVYALAFVPRRVPLAVFVRDAVLLKAASLAVFAAVYLTASPDLLSLLIVGLGLFLNLAAAHALGTERTYYGFELAALPPKRITAFPYSVIGHPMLIGNAIAFAGTLLNAEFRSEWWPLALAHVGLNLAVLVMEVKARPHQPIPAHGLDRLASWQAGSAVILLGTLIAGFAGGGPLFVAGVAAAHLAFALVLFNAYVRPPAPAGSASGDYG
jgi:hypothetical protein